MVLSANQKGLIVVGTTIFILTSGFFLLKKYLNPISKKSNPNFLQLQENTGLKSNKENTVFTKFNDGENQAQFYTNDRVFIFDKNGNVLNKGKYEDGGKKIILDSGKVISGNSVWQNLLDILKK